MKRSTTKVMAISICAAIVISSIAVTSYASEQSGKETAETPVKTETAVSETQDISKDETVYVIANSDGSVRKIIVSDWLKNAMSSQTLEDKSELSDIENVNGDEVFTSGENGSIVWDAQGNDIYYQGNIEKELPVKMAVTYTLDGNQVTPDELLGKSGKVTIRYDFTNDQYETVKIGGKDEKIYVPFAVMTGMVLDNDLFRNVEISGGKIVNDGSRTAVIGIALPGLQENLAIPEDEFTIPDHFEITADVTDFRLGMTVTVATNQLFNEIDPESITTGDELKDSLGQLTDAVDQLMDGSSQLYDGITTLLTSSGDLADGVDKLAEGSLALKNGAGELDKGAGDLQSGAAELSSGLDALASNNDSLNDGAKQVFETLLSTAQTQLAAAGLEVPELTIDNYDKVLDNVIASLDEKEVYKKALSQVTSAVEEKRSYINEQVTAAVEKEVTAKVTEAVKGTVTEQVIASALNMTVKDYNAAVSAGLIDKNAQGAVDEAVARQMSSQNVQDIITAKVAEQMKSDAIKKTISENTESQVQKAISDNMASDEVKAQLASASEGERSVIELRSSLDSYKEFYSGLKEYTAGVSQASEGAKQLKSGTDRLKSGASDLSEGAAELDSGIGTLKESIPELTDGVTQLQEGAKQLSDGLNDFNEQGIKKLSDAVNVDLEGLIERLRATVEVSKNYRNFSGAAENAGGQVKFIYRTDSIE